MQQAGASELVVWSYQSAGYRAEHIDWQAIGEIRQRLTIPAREWRNLGLAERAGMYMATSGCDAVMIGRGGATFLTYRVVKYNEPRMSYRKYDVITKIYPTSARAIPVYIMSRIKTVRLDIYVRIY
ncbi:tRNA-dihydrouridine synthase [Salmonella enterica subsp. enterica]|nr:tRNA-dihydrouridine synthase [Salmonella enterica subsp. enterica]